MSEMDSVYSECFVWAVGLFLIGIMFREFSPDGLGKWIGRSAVAASVFLLSSFSYYAHNQCHVQYQITAAKSAKGISHAHEENRAVAEASEAGREVRTPEGRTITVRLDANDGGIRSMPGATDGIRRSISGRGLSNQRTGRGIDSRWRANGSLGQLPYAEPKLSEMK